MFVKTFWRVLKLALNLKLLPMAEHFYSYIVRIERSVRKLEFLFSTLLRQQRQPEQLKVLLEILIALKSQSLREVQQEEWLDSFEVMRVYKISRSTLYRWKCKELLKPNRIGNRDIYLRRDLEHLFSMGMDH